MDAARCGRGVLVFGALGLVWAAQLASLLRVGCFAHDDGLVIGLPVVIPAAMSVLGCMVAWIVARDRQEGGMDARWPTVVLLVPFAGLLSGVVVGLGGWPDQVPTAAGHGLAFGAVALALLSPMLVTMGHEARPRSLLDETNRLATWAYVRAAACASSVITLPT